MREMKVDKGQMMQFLSARRVVFKMPLYQRAYSWTKEECCGLFNDLIRVATSKREHFIGPVVHSDGAFSLTQVCSCQIIDGQQRITTIYLLLLAMYRFLMEQTDEGSIALAQSLKEYLLVDNREIDEFSTIQDLKLQLTDFDNQQLLRLLKNPFNPPKESHLIYQNFEFFYQEIRSGNLSVSELLESLERLIIVDLALERGQDDPQIMFESLNATGKGLTPGDLIQNFLFMDLDEEFQDSIYRQYWFPLASKIQQTQLGELTDFIQQYLVLKNKKQIGNKKQLYQAFKNYFNDHCPDKNTSSVKAFVIDLAHYSNQYLYLKEITHPVKEIEEALKPLRSLNITTIVPLCLEILSYHETKKISTADTARALRLIESFIVRRFICDKPTNELPHVFLKLLKNLQPVDFKVQFEQAFMRFKGNQIFPRDEEFKACLLTKPLYSDLKYCQHLLRAIINRHSREILNIKDFTIEHIMPQTTNLRKEWIEALGDDWKETHETYVHTIGNLTLTRYNSEMGTKSFKEKKYMSGGFNDSICWLNKILVDVEVWNKESILNRGMQIGMECCQIWDIPRNIELDCDYSLILSLDDDWTGQKVQGFKLMGEKHEVRDLTELLVALVKEFYVLNGETDELFIRYNRRLTGANKLFAKEAPNRNWKWIGDSGYAMDTGCSSKAKKDIVSKLLDDCGLSESDLEIYLKLNEV